MADTKERPEKSWYATTRPRRSKVAPPAAGAFLIERSRLDEWAEQAARAALALFQAPAGFGKTTLMSQLVGRFDARNVRTAWLTLDRNDNDLARFSAGLLSVLQGIDPHLDPTAFDRDSFETAAVLLNIQEWVAAYPNPFALFLDDFEVIRNSDVKSALHEILGCLPPGRTFLVASREIPDLGLGRLRVSGRLMEVHADDLRFAAGEAEAFFRGGHALPLDDEDIAQLLRNTEGWAAALQLAALVLAGSGDRKHLIRSFSGTHCHIAEYLAEEVLALQTEEVREFLLKTCVLDRLSGPLCDAVTGRRDSCRMLSQLERANLFLLPMDEDRIWYRYHNVFLEFLRGRLEREFPGGQHGLHRAAAEWYVSNGSPVEATQHAFSAGDLERAAELAAGCALPLVRAGQIGTVHRWTQKLPTEIVDRYPKLRIALCWALGLRNRFQEASAVLDAIRAGLEEDDGVDPRSADQLLVLEALALEEQGDECLRLAQTNLPKMSDRRSFACGILMNILGGRLSEAGQFDEAQRTLLAARQNHLQTGSLLGLTYGECLIGSLHLTQGRLRDALQWYRSAFTRVRSRVSGYSMPGVVSAVFLAEALYESDELDEAEKVLDEFRDLLPRNIFLDFMLLGFVTRARIWSARGSADKAAQLYGRLESLGEERQMPRMAPMVRLEQIRAALQRGDVEAAARTAEAGSARGERDVPERWSLPIYDAETTGISRSRLLVRRGKTREALSLLRSELETAETARRFRRALKLKILMAEAFGSAGEEKLAMRTLGDAVRVACKEGFVRTFVDEGPGVMKLVGDLRTTCDAGGDRSLVPFLDRLLSALPRPAVASTEDVAADMDGLEALTQRECEILQLASVGMSNRALSEQLLISVDTVKYHLRNIYRKLNSGNRTEAVSKARFLGLIS